MSGSRPWCLMHCRTAEMGGHALKCPDGHVTRCFYNSCWHRFCRRCSFRAVEEWLRRPRARFPDCRYYHLIFTIPHDLNDLWLQNVPEMTELLFHVGPAGRARLKPITLTAEEFIRRVLLHVPPPGAQWCRSYGLFACVEVRRQASRVPLLEAIRSCLPTGTCK